MIIEHIKNKWNRRKRRCKYCGKGVDYDAEADRKQSIGCNGIC